MDDAELRKLRTINNPNNEPVGHYTGRCKNCHSKDLWWDYSAYGCNCCEAIYFTGDMCQLVRTGGNNG